MEVIRITAAWVLLGMITIAGAIILYRMASNEIKLEKLISEQDGTASMARFQLLIFTFVVALSVFYVTIAPDAAGLPEIPVGVLTLLGVSASGYGVGKLLQGEIEKSKPAKKDKDEPPVKEGEVTYRPPAAGVPKGGKS